MPDHGNAGMVTVLVTMRVKPNLEDDYLAFAQAVMETRPPRGTRRPLYAMHPHPELPYTFRLGRRYASQAALNAHGASEHMTEAFKKLPYFLDEPSQMLELRQALPACADPGTTFPMAGLGGCPSTTSWRSRRFCDEQRSATI